MAISNYDPGQELSSINFAGMIGGPLTAAVDAQTQAALATVDFIKTIGFSPDTVDDTTGEVTPGTPVYVSFKYPKQVAPYVPAVNGIIDTFSMAAAGSGYANDEVLSIGSGNATVKITTDPTDGKIISINILNAGSDYNTGTGIPLVGGSGSGATVNITAVKIRAAEAAKFEQMILEVPMLTLVPIPYLRIDFVEIDFHAKINSMEYRNVGSQFELNTGMAISSTTSASGAGGLKLRAINIRGNVSNTTSVDFKVNASYQKSVKEGHKIDKTYQLGVKVRASQDEMPGGMEKILGILEDAIVAQPVIG